MRTCFGRLFVNRGRFSRGLLGHRAADREPAIHRERGDHRYDKGRRRYHALDGGAPGNGNLMQNLVETIFGHSRPPIANLLNFSRGERASQVPERAIKAAEFELQALRPDCRRPQRRDGRPGSA